MNAEMRELIDDAEREYIFDMMENGMTRTEIAEEMAISVRTLNKLANRLGLVLNDARLRCHN